MTSRDYWQLRPGLALPLDRPRILAIVNVTPDSFALSSPMTDTGAAVAFALEALSGGADALDIGGESTRPGAAVVDEAEEVRRVAPVIRALRAQAGAAGVAPITVDTTKAGVARAALDAGADAVNDTSAGTSDTAMLPLIASRRCGVVLMHRVMTPQRESYSDRYDEPPIAAGVTDTVTEHLKARARAAVEAGVDRDAIMADPGLGFGKTVEQNLELIRRTPEIIERVGLPVLSALSRKSFVGRAGLSRDSTPDERLSATLALSTLHLTLGARLFRVHDVAAHRQALGAAWAALRGP